MMSTDKKKKKRFRKIERIKIIEYGLIALVVALFVVLAIIYGAGKNRQSEEALAEAGASPSPVETQEPSPEPTPPPTPVPTPVPTKDPSIRGKNVLDALEQNGFSVSYESSQYIVTAPNGTVFDMRMESVDRRILKLTVETPLCPDPEGDSVTDRMLREENERTVAALRELFKCLLPVFHRDSASDGDSIVKECQNTVRTGKLYSKGKGKVSVRIETFDAGPENLIQYVRVELIPDS